MIGGGGVGGWVGVGGAWTGQVDVARESNGYYFMFKLVFYFETNKTVFYSEFENNSYDYFILLF